VKVNVFERGTNFFFDYPSIDLLDSNVTQLEEVYQSTTSLNLLSDNMMIILPAFVLSENVLVDRPRIPTLVGIVSLFLLQYCINGKAVPPGFCLSFPSQCVDLPNLPFGTSCCSSKRCHKCPPLKALPTSRKMHHVLAGYPSKQLRSQPISVYCCHILLVGLSHDFNCFETTSC
jgi:hypothetical protein